MYTNVLSICVQKNSWRTVNLGKLCKSRSKTEGEEGHGLIVVMYKGDILFKGLKSELKQINFTRAWNQTGKVRKVIGVQGSAF